MHCIFQQNRLKLFALGLSLAVAGCASTKVEVTGKVLPTSICQAQNESLTALVFWHTNWRAEQKDMQHREEAARLGLQDFLSTSTCFASHQLKRIQVANNHAVVHDSELLALASAAYPKPDRVLLVTVRELGPTVKLFSSAALLEGETEVKLDLKVLDTGTGNSIADLQTHWQNGGALVVKGVDTLPQDMQAAMRAAFAPPTRTP